MQWPSRPCSTASADPARSPSPDTSFPAARGRVSGWSPCSTVGRHARSSESSSTCSRPGCFRMPSPPPTASSATSRPSAAARKRRANGRRASSPPTRAPFWRPSGISMPKRPTERALLEDLPDGAARRAIRHDLSTTILVEAAAGTGKTASLVGRMVALVATDATTVDKLSAVTFTIRAAAQLKQRFQNGLEEALAAEKDEPTARRLADGLAHLDSCFVGTIHAFGARLLRERPVEAGVDPGFVEMDDPEDGAARREAWDRFSEELFLTGDPRLARLIELGIPLGDLSDSFKSICENSDVEVEIGARLPEPDFTTARAEVEVFLENAAALLPAEAPPGGWSDFELAVRRARRLRELLGSGSAPDFVQILRVLRKGSVQKAVPAPLKRTFQRLREEVVKPALAAWEEYVYPDVCAILVDARERYRRWRLSEGRLNFQDLLLCARDLLRDHPDVRSALSRRFTPVLVDEFHD